MSVANHEPGSVKKPKKPIIKRPPKTIKERKFVKTYLQTGNAKEAIKAAYNVSSDKSARAMVSETLSKLALTDIMDNMGLTDEALVGCLKDGLYNSKKIIGTPDNFIEVDDKATQHRYLNTAFQLKDKFPKDRIGLEATDGKNTVRVLIEKA